jgi:hypothetical protein
MPSSPHTCRPYRGHPTPALLARQVHLRHRCPPQTDTADMANLTWTNEVEEERLFLRTRCAHEAWCQFPHISTASPLLKINCTDA